MINRQALDEIHAGFVDAMEDFLILALSIAQPNVPDEPPYGVGLVKTGAYGVWSDGKKVAGNASKPRDVKVRGQGIVGAAGYAWPGRYAEGGTIHEHPRPFLTPAFMQAVPEAPALMARRQAERAHA